MYTRTIVLHVYLTIRDVMESLLSCNVFQKADVAAAPITVTVLREDVVDFTYGFMTFEAVAVINRRQGKEEPVNSLDDLINQGFQFGIRKGSVIHEAIKDSPVEQHKRVLESLDVGSEDAFMDTNNDGVEKARYERDYAFLLEEPTADWVLKQPPCDLQMVKTGIYKRKYALALNEASSDLRDKLNKGIVELQLKGIMHDIKEKYWGEDACAGSEQTVIVSFLLIVSCAVIAVQNMFS